MNSSLKKRSFKRFAFIGVNLNTGFVKLKVEKLSTGKCKINSTRIFIFFLSNQVIVCKKLDSGLKRRNCFLLYSRVTESNRVNGRLCTLEFGFKVFEISGFSVRFHRSPSVSIYRYIDRSYSSTRSARISHRPKQSVV